MKVKDLIDLLRAEDPEKEIFYYYDGPDTECCMDLKVSPVEDHLIIIGDSHD